jgi:hypothetical protein
MFLLIVIEITLIQISIIGALFSLPITLVRWVAKKISFRYKNLLLVTLVLSSFLIGTYKSSRSYSDIWIGIAFDGYMDKDENLSNEYWSKFYIYPFVQKSCYTQDLQKCQSWADFLGPYQGTKITSSGRFWAYLIALVFGFISGGISLLISNSLWNERVSRSATT